jgi:hypothetical protein
MSQPLLPMKGEPMLPCQSARKRDPIDHFIPGLPGSAGYLAQAFFANLVSEQELQYPKSGLAYLATVMMDPETGLLECMNPLIYAAAARTLDPDTPQYHEAMQSKDAKNFRDAMVAEIIALTSKKTRTLVSRDSIVGKNVLPGTWTFKRKRHPDGCLQKCKARFCVHSDMQVKGVDYFETYAPVVQWSTVRALLVMSIILGLESQQIDYSNAFYQTNILEEVYVEMPKDFGDKNGRDMVLKLSKSLNGTKQAPQAWFLKLMECLEKQGFRKSRLNPCFFIHKDMIYLNYVDDGILLSCHGAKLDAMIADLKTNLELT